MSATLPLETIVLCHGNLSERVSSPRYHWRAADRGDVDFVIIQSTESGAGFFEVKGKRHAVPSGHAFISIVPERAAYGFPTETLEPWVFSWVNFYGKFACRLMSAFRDTYGPVVPMPETSGLTTRFRDLVTLSMQVSGDPFTRSARSYDFVMDWCSELRQAPRGSNAKIEALRIHIETRYYEPWSIKNLADHLGVSREHLTREYTGATGISPASHLRQRRARAASEIIERTKLPLSEVARRSGFTDARQLARALKAMPEK